MASFERVWVASLVLILAGCSSTAPAPPTLYVTERGKGGSQDEGLIPQATTQDVLEAQFAGRHRKGPKTTIVDIGTEEEFTDLEELLDTLPSDLDMIEAFDDFAEETGDPEGKFAEERLPDEERNVRVQAWLFAAKYESDNDFHLILGSSSDRDEAMFMNMEVSGLPNPETEDTPTLQAVREQLHDLLGKYPGKRYSKLADPIEVEVEGSLFYDIDHGPGVVGPLGMRPDTSWEVHPITDLQGGHDD